MRWFPERARYPERLIRQLPNLISVLRACLAPVVFRAIWNREYENALLWLFLAAFSDILDGWLARRMKVVSRAGAYLDPLADKILLSGTYFLLGYDRVIPMWLTGIVFGRDALMLVSVVLICAFTPLRNFPPTVWGKLSTLVQIVAAFLVMLNGILSFGPDERNIRMAIYIIAALATVWSAIDYLRIGIRMLKSGEPGKLSN